MDFFPCFIYFRQPPNPRWLDPLIPPLSFPRKSKRESTRSFHSNVIGKAGRVYII